MTASRSRLANLGWVLALGVLALGVLALGGWVSLATGRDARAWIATSAEALHPTLAGLSLRRAS